MGMMREKPVILIVDDDLGVRTQGRVMFGLFEYQTDSATTVDIAIRAIHKHESRYVMALIDISLKGPQNGFDLLNYIKRTAFHRVLPYVLTGHRTFALEEMALKAGAFDVFDKSSDVWDRLVIRADYERNPVWDLFFKSLEDDLTGLSNFKQFSRLALEHLKTARDRKHPAVLSLLSIDIDGLKHINDTHGHSVGDEAIKAVADTLKEHMRKEYVRPTDLLCHKSGDEFLILLSDADKPAALEFGRRLQKEVSDSPVAIAEDVVLPISISFGLSQVSCEDIQDPQESFDVLIDLADTGHDGLIERRRSVRG